VVGLYVSYGIPILLRLVAEAKGKFSPKHLGPWNLGKWGRPISVIALLWIAFISVIMVIPPNQNAGFALIGMMFLLIVMDFAYYRKHFPGPQAALNVTEEELLLREAELEG
jgi:uncharacterized BrkB/YihY/UPF0761 family membrane protein